MSNTSLDRVIQEVKALAPEQQKKVKELIDSLLGSPGEAKTTQSLEDLLEQRLLEDGVISKLPTRDFDPETYKEFEPIEVSGKPVSETIIEERG